MEMIRHLRLPREETLRTVVTVASILLLIGTIVPLLLIAPYDHPGADDLVFGRRAHEALASGGGILEVIEAACATVTWNWFEWQGTYSAIFLMALQPGVFSEQAYAITPFIVIGSLVAGELFFSHVLLVEKLGFSRRSWLSITCLLLVVEILYQPNVVEGFFWFNGAVYYTSFTSLMFVLLGLLVRLVDGSRTRWIPLCIGCCLLGAFLAGGNFVTVLLSLEAVLCLGALIFLVTHDRKRVLRLAAPFAVLVVGFLVSYIAPGNAVRASFFTGYGIDSTVLASFVSATQASSEWLTGALVLMLLVVGAIAWSELDEKSWSFPRPWLFTLFSYCWLASSWAPTFFAMGSAGSGRTQDIRFDLLAVLCVANIIWWLGNIKARSRVTASQTRAVPTFAVAFFFGCALVVDLVCIASSSTLGEDLSSASALRSLVRGEAQAYDQEVWEQIDILATDTTGNPQIPLVEAKPATIDCSELSEDPGDWVNVAYAQWYGKNTITGIDTVPDVTE